MANKGCPKCGETENICLVEDVDERDGMVLSWWFRCDECGHETSSSVQV